MVEIYCNGNCGTTVAEWKVIMNKAFRKEYRQKKMYFCSECIIDLLDGSSTGPFKSDIKKIIKLKKRIKKKLSEESKEFIKKLEKEFPKWNVECCALIYPDPEEVKYCVGCGESLKKEIKEN